MTAEQHSCLVIWLFWFGLIFTLYSVLAFFVLFFSNAIPFLYILFYSYTKSTLPLQAIMFPCGPHLIMIYAHHQSYAHVSSHFSCPKSFSSRISGRAHWNKFFSRVLRKGHRNTISWIPACQYLSLSFYFWRSVFLDIKSLAHIFFFWRSLICYSILFWHIALLPMISNNNLLFLLHKIY